MTQLQLLKNRTQVNDKSVTNKQGAFLSRSPKN